MQPLSIDRNKEYYTVEEYLTWDENFRAELHEGRLVLMAPPSASHQEVLMEIAAQLHTFLKGKPCKVYPAPFGVKLFDNEETIYEPDIAVICDKSKIDKICCGAPDLVIEIRSPATARKDLNEKYKKYEHAGVREYWIVDPEANHVQAGVLHNGKYITKLFGAEDELAPVSVLEGCVINLKDVFSEE